MKKNLLARLILSTAMIFSVVGFVPNAMATHTPVHVLHVSGISTFPGACQYVEAKDSAGNIIKDELSIPKPSTLPPTCKTNPSTGAPLSCRIARNTNPVPGSRPACAGNISAEDSFGVGCVDPMTTRVQCGLRAPTWFYGYCGQTYGGAVGGTFTINGEDYTIQRTGFTRGRGIWEFSGRMHLNSNTSVVKWYRMHLAAAPDKPTQAAGCDVTHDIESIVFAGVLEIYSSPLSVPPKTFRTSVGWHFCDDDFGPGGMTGPVNNPFTGASILFKAGTAGENC